MQCANLSCPASLLHAELSPATSSLTRLRSCDGWLQRLSGYLAQLSLACPCTEKGEADPCKSPAPSGSSQPADETFNLSVQLLPPSDSPKPGISFARSVSASLSPTESKLSGPQPTTTTATSSLNLKPKPAQSPAAIPSLRPPPSFVGEDGFRVSSDDRKDLIRGNGFMKTVIISDSQGVSLKKYYKDPSLSTSVVALRGATLDSVAMEDDKKNFQSC